MEQHADDLWTETRDQRFLGLEVGTRMTVVRLPDGGLWLHSPVAPSPELVDELGKLGPIRCLVAPNRFHHLYVGAWREHAPEAAIFGAPRLAEKRADLVFDGVLGDGPDPRWAGTLDQVWMQGFRLAEEVVFFHAASSTLIASDLGFNVGPSAPLGTRIALRAIGAAGPLQPTLLERLGIRDRPAFRQALERVLAWPFERVIVAHGDVLEREGPARLREAYAFLLS